MDPGSFHNQSNRVILVAGSPKRILPLAIPFGLIATLLAFLAYAQNDPTNLQGALIAAIVGGCLVLWARSFTIKLDLARDTCELRAAFTYYSGSCSDIVVATQCRDPIREILLLTVRDKEALRQFRFPARLFQASDVLLVINALELRRK